MAEWYWCCGVLAVVQVDFSGCVRVSGEGLRLLFQGCPELKSVDLTKCYNIDDEAMEVWESAVPQCFLLFTLYPVCTCKPNWPQFVTPPPPPSVCLCATQNLEGELPALETFVLNGCRRLTGTTSCQHFKFVCCANFLATSEPISRSHDDTHS